MTPRTPPTEALVPSRRSTSTDLLALLSSVPEEEVWLQEQISRATRAAYRLDVAGFMDFADIRSPAQLRLVTHTVAVAWRRSLEEAGLKPSTIRRKLAALSSLFAHLIAHQAATANPFRDVKRPRVNRRQGSTPAFSIKEARAILDAPDPETLRGLRDRALFSVGFQAGPRRASIERLRVRDFGRDSGYDTLRFQIKGGTAHTVALHPQTGQRIRAYLEAAGHGADVAGPLFRPIVGKVSLRKPLSGQSVDRLLRSYAHRLKIKGRHSAHSLRATFITTALAGGASLEDVQAAAGHADPSTTKLYDRRGYNPEKSAAFFANY